MPVKYIFAYISLLLNNKENKMAKTQSFYKYNVYFELKYPQNINYFVDYSIYIYETHVLIFLESS
jgi:hypothetical protein